MQISPHALCAQESEEKGKFGTVVLEGIAKEKAHLPKAPTADVIDFNEILLQPVKFQHAWLLFVFSKETAHEASVAVLLFIDCALPRLFGLYLCSLFLDSKD